jgi:hypothetical protein
MSKLKHIAIAAAAWTGFCALPTLAQPTQPSRPTQPAQQSQQAPARAPARLEITMTLLPENAKDTSEITRKIALPSPSDQRDGQGGKRPADLPGAGQGKGEGLEKAAEARERGREFGQEVAEQARENRENAGKRHDPPGPPPDRPGPKAGDIPDQGGARPRP